MALVRFASTVEAVERCGDDVVLLALSKPQGYRFAAGQWFRMFLTTGEGEQGRTFSHASAPHERSLLVATRLSGSAFKRALTKVAAGDVVEISSSSGRLALPEAARHLLVLTGGVGVAPVRSLLYGARGEGRRFADVLVVYGVRDASCVPFAEDLAALSDLGVRVVTVCEHPGTGWGGESGLITGPLVRRHLRKPLARPTIITGPPAMVEAMEGVLDALGIDESQRIVERFGAAHSAG